MYTEDGSQVTIFSGRDFQSLMVRGINEFLKMSVLQAGRIIFFEYRFLECRGLN